jgi:hypothetical protein
MRLSDHDRDRLLKAANTVIEEAGVDYNKSLPTLLRELLIELKNKNLKKLLRQSYHLKATAGSFGWSIVSQAAGFIHLAVEKEKTSDALLEVSIVLFQRLLQQVLDDNHEETEECVTMLKTMYWELDKQGSLE